MTPVNLELPKLDSQQEVVSRYHIREVRFDQDLRPVIERWKECNAHFEDQIIFCDPEWLQKRVELEKANIRIFLIETGAEIVGAVPLELYPHRLACKLGDRTLARIPINVCRVLGYTPNLPSGEASHDLFFQRLLLSEFDAIYMTGVRSDSFFWAYLQSSPFIKKHFHLYSERGVRPHPYVRILGSFEEYMRKFSSKTRNNFSRQLRKLREKGEVQLIKVTEEAEVGSFVEAAADISKKTYQFRVLGIGIRNRDQLQEWLKWAARQGWLRSYLLICGQVACAFQIGYQYHGEFLGVEVGFDPDWGKLGVGIVQQLLALEDLFKVDSPSVADLGTYAEYKQLLANESYSDALVWLFRRKPYPSLALSIYRLFGAASIMAGDLLQRFNLKSRVRKIIRS